MTTAAESSKVEVLVRRGWQRRLMVLAVDESALVLGLLAAGFSLLILLGTQILAWQWLVALGCIGLGLATYGIQRRLVDRYRVAQIMDRELVLHDSLSTAWYLKTSSAVTRDRAVSFQLTRAEELAQSADPAAAFPFERRRAWTITGALCMLAMGLFSARYLVTRELSLRRSFLPITLTEVFEQFRHGGNESEKDRNAAAKDQGLPPGLLARNEDGARNAQEEKSRRTENADGGPNANNSTTSGQNSEQARGENGKPGDQDASNGNRSSGDGAKADQQGNDGQDAQTANGSKNSENLMDRMRDALSSVMAKIKPSSNSNSAQSPAQNDANGVKNNQAGMKDQSGDGQKDAGNQQTAQEQAEGNQQGQGASKSQQSQGKDSAQASDKKGSDAQSGVGHSDGDKELRAAEQAKAMGKLAEIIGKRSASLTGDMEIEPSGKQKLETQYTHQQGQHSDLGGEINRDEVPVEDQEYVREYMELVRKKPAKTTSR